MGSFKEAAGRAARVPAQPLLRYADRRFEDMHTHLDNRIDEVQTQVAESLALTRQLKAELDTDVQVIAELTLTLQRFAEHFGERIDEVLASLEGTIGAPPERGKGE